MDREIVERLLQLLKGYVRDLKEVQGVSLGEYLKDVKTQRFVERTLQIAIEASLDVGHHIISSEGLREPESNREVFRILGEEGILPPHLQKRLEEMASFRNLLVHSYGKIDNTIVYGILNKRLQDFEEFMECIIRYLDRKEG